MHTNERALSESEQYAADACATARSMMAEGEYDAPCADDPRTFNTAEAIAYLREQRERAHSAFQGFFDAPDRPRNVTARQAMNTGDWGGFFGSCLAG